MKSFYIILLFSFSLAGIVNAKGIKHIVMWKLDENTKENRDYISQTVSPLAKIKGVKKLTVSENITDVDPDFANQYNFTQFDLVLIIDFKDLKSYEDYGNDPIHLEAADKVVPMLSQTSIVDIAI